MSDEEPNPNAPTERQAAILRPPNARHRASTLDHRTKGRRAINTVAMPWVDFGRDVEAILAGECIREGNRFTVNGRVYVLEGEGRLFPVRGDGLHQLGRGAYRALGLYNSGGITETVELALDRELIREDERQIARVIWRELQAWRERMT
jgi:hypothetical protein